MNFFSENKPAQSHSTRDSFAINLIISVLYKRLIFVGIVLEFKFSANWKLTGLTGESHRRLRLPYTFRGLSCPSDVARPV